jgi:hypothetical protein
MNQAGFSPALVARIAVAAVVAIAVLSPASTSAAGPPQCRTSGLVIWSNNGAGGGTAGSV